MEAATGRAVLGAVEEVSLEEVLDSLRAALDPTTYPSSTAINTTTTNTNTNTNTRNTTATSHHGNKPKVTYIEDLDAIATRHFRDTQSPTLSLCGRTLPLLYTLISRLVSPPHHMALLIIDLDSRFDATCLTCPAEHLAHVYVQRPARSSPEALRALVADAEGFMLYGGAAQGSVGREWWGTVVLGGLGAGDVASGWKGWLRVEREAVREFAMGVSGEEAVARRGAREEVVDGAGWMGTSEWGGFVFRE